MWLQTLCVYALWHSGFGFADTVIIIIIIIKGCFANENAGLCCQIWMSLTVDLAYGPH